MFFISIYLIITAYSLGVIAKPPQKIVGGERVKENEFPYMVSLKSEKNEHFCGGSIISSRHILTAAHCVNRRNFTTIVAMIGSNRLSSGGTSHKIKKISWPREFQLNDRLGRNDIAVLTLSEPLSSNVSNWQPIKLASRDYEPGSPATLIGFGKTDENATIEYSEHLLKIELELAPLSQCNQLKPLQVNDHLLCLLPTNGKTSCIGDSGSPLVVNGEVVGIASQSSTCGVSITLFTKVFQYLDFINRELSAKQDEEIVKTVVLPEKGVNSSVIYPPIPKMKESPGSGIFPPIPKMKESQGSGIYPPIPKMKESPCSGIFPLIPKMKESPCSGIFPPIPKMKESQGSGIYPPNPKMCGPYVTRLCPPGQKVSEFQNCGKFPIPLFLCYQSNRILYPYK